MADNTWELSKENFIPRKEGRRVDTLADPAALSSTGKKLELDAQRRQLWREVQAYSGDDPLEPWQRCAATLAGGRRPTRSCAAAGDRAAP
jgi:checkpoint serine/threonine-protein kinase